LYCLIGWELTIAVKLTAQISLENIFTRSRALFYATEFTKIFRTIVSEGIINILSKSTLPTFNKGNDTSRIERSCEKLRISFAKSIERDSDECNPENKIEKTAEAISASPLLRWSIC
jgi:hypothetical protein